MISIGLKKQDEYYYLPGPQEEKFYGIFVGRGTYAGGLSIRSSLSEEWLISMDMLMKKKV